MAQFISYREGIEGNIDIITPYYNADTRGKSKRMEIFAKHGIDMNKKKVYPIQVLLNYFKEIAEVLGDMNIFLVGRTTSFEMPLGDVNNLKDVIEQVNITYHSMYRLNGEPMYNPKTKEFTEGLGSYTVSFFDEKQKEMHVLCSSPFPSKSDEGFFNGFLERFKNKFHYNSYNVKLDTSKERREQGADTCTFIITWK